MLFYVNHLLFGFLRKFPVVVASATGTILYSSLHIEQVCHFVNHGCNYILNRSIHPVSRYVQFVPLLVSFLPYLCARNVSIRCRCALNGDNRFFDFSVETVLIDLPEHFLKVSGGSTCFYCLFHVFVPPFF